MVNKVILIGNLGRDPELRYTQSGTAVATLNMATSRRRKDQDGNYIDETEWHRVIAWAKTAEFCGNYLSKGHKIYVEGRLQTRKWTDQNGQDRYTTEVVAENLQSLTPKGSSSAGGFQEPPPPDDPFGTGGGSMGSGGFDSGAGGDMGTGDDVPF
ncbi:MAG: single-stranded DNA-binding protein [Deltaproteobacteria bacterium]|nr:MAG: single-stranded DNA-binding protein [Deltaproteobacteria bacterium]